MLIFFIFVLAVIDFSVQSNLSEGSACLLHTGEKGICKKSLDCRWLIDSLNRRRMTLYDIRRCSFSIRSEDIVCCNDPASFPNTDIPTKPPCTYDFQFDCVPYTRRPVDQICVGCKAKAVCAKFSDTNSGKPNDGFVHTTLVHGKPALQNEIPHIAALGYPMGRSYVFECGGTLISDKWVVTAAHCIKDKRKPVIVRMGKLNLHDDTDGLIAIDRSILQIIRHPKYMSLRKKNDIALIELNEELIFNDDIRPACIRTDVYDIPDDVELMVSGWGSIDAERFNRSKVLLKGSLFIVPLERCNETFVRFNELTDQPSLRGLLQSQMCALNRETNTDSCQGDSGGPLFTKDESGGKIATVHGVVTFGVSCGTELPGVYTRIASYVDWIESIVWPN